MGHDDQNAVDIQLRGDKAEWKAFKPLIRPPAIQTIQAATALGQIGGGPLTALLHDESSQTPVQEIAWALGQIGDRRSIPALQEIVARAPPFGSAMGADEATKALEKFGAPVPPRQGK